MKYITTSWDDGHPLDFKVANLLEKYTIQGTFYIPRRNVEHEVMPEEKVVELSHKFEIGGHTLNHLRLHPMISSLHNYEVSGSYNWLLELLDKQPVSFCFPGGVYSKPVIKTVKEAGFKVFRTTELLSVACDLKTAVLSTSLQMYEHSKFTYIKHLLKRRRLVNFVQWMKSGPTTRLLKLTDYYLRKIDSNGHGCFHLWGHSWEIEEFSLWNKLEEVLKLLSEYDNFLYVQNKDMLNIPQLK